MPHPKAIALHGLLTAILTPFEPDGSLAPALVPDLLTFQREAGVDGVVVSGTNGEGVSLSVEERKQVLEEVMGHKGELQVVAGTGAASVSDAVELTRHAARVQADAALVLPPFFFKNPTARGLADYYLRVLDSADLPILLYSIPQFSAIAISDEVLDLLIDHPNLSGVKDSAGDWKRTQAIVDRYPQLRIFAGSDGDATRAWRSGAAGAISGTANSFPEVVAAVRDAYFDRRSKLLNDAAWIRRSADRAEAPLKQIAEQAGIEPTAFTQYMKSEGPIPTEPMKRIAASLQERSAERSQARLNALIGIVTRYPLIAVSKSILAHRGFPRMGVRPPLVSLSPAQETELLQELWAEHFF